MPEVLLKPQTGVRRMPEVLLVSRLLAALALTALVSCHSHAPPEAAVARRVVSLSPSTTEALAAIGARQALVGRSRYCDYPPDVATLPEVGGYVDPSYEAILALAPDLVTGARGPSGPDLSTRLTARGIATYFPVTESFDGIDAMLRGLGARTGHVSDAERVVARLHAEEAAVRGAVAGRPKVRALFLFGISPIVAAGPGGFPDEMLKRAGGENVVTDGSAYPTLGLEHVLALDPDVIIDAAWGEPQDQGRLSADTPGWRELRAVKAGRVVSLRDEVVLRPGPRIGDGLRLLAKALHPDAAIH
jgi:iron complex transport system substrate-binding protein